MAKQLQIRGGTTVQHSTFTGALREITIDTDKDVVVVHDGTTVGGFPLAKQTSVDSKVTKVTSTDNAIVRFNGATGDIQNSDVIIDDNGNVGIGTSSPANSKFNRTFTTQVTGISSVAITAGDYSSGADSIVTVIESLGARGDSNSTFGGRFGASYRRNSGEVIPSGNTIGYYAFGGQWGTDVGYTPSKHLYTASICGVSEGAFTSDTAMPTGISFRTGSTGENLGTVNTTYGTERMRIDASGNVLLTSGTGALGYGAGAGGIVTQLTSKSTAVTLNKPSGTIYTHNESLAAGASVTFQVFNSQVSVGSLVFVCMSNESWADAYSVESRWISDDSFYITLTNTISSAVSGSLSIKFAIIKGTQS